MWKEVGNAVVWSILLTLSIHFQIDNTIDGFYTMYKTKFSLKHLIIFTASAFILSLVIANVNTLSSVTHNLAAVLFLGFLSCAGFLLGCIFMYKLVAGIPFKWAILGCFLSPLLFYIINLIINAFQDLSYLFQPDFEKTLWIYALMLYFSSNVLCLFIMKPLLDKKLEQQERIDRATGKIK